MDPNFGDMSAWNLSNQGGAYPNYPQDMNASYPPQGGYPAGPPMGFPQPSQYQPGVAPSMGYTYPNQTTQPGIYPGPQPVEGMCPYGTQMGAGFQKPAICPMKISGNVGVNVSQDINEPTLRPSPNFDAQKDCERLKKAMAGLGTNEKELIEVMGHRTASQRVEIVRTYKSMYGKELISKLRSELSGNLLTCMEALCYSPAEFDARELRRAMRGAGTDEDILIEILCSRTNQQIKDIKKVYSEVFKSRDLEADLKSETSGHFKRILVALVQGNRDESPKYDMNSARKDAEELYAAGEKMLGTDESKFNYILVSRSYPHLRAVFEEYGKVSKKTMEQALKSEMSGDLLKSFLTIVRCIQNKPKYFAEQLKKSMQGLGTRDHTLIRIIVTRCEVDMGQIKKEFLSLNGKTLESWIHDDTTGDYRKLLLSLVGS